MASKSTNQQRDQTARTHSGQSNRRTKDRGESKTVFKSVLANPFEVKWPVIPLNVQNAILARVVELLQGVAEYNINRHKQSRATKAGRRAQKRAKTSGGTGQQQQTVIQDAIEQSARDKRFNPWSLPPPSTDPNPEPEILQHTVIGINAVTKRLEAQCRVHRRSVSGGGGAETYSELNGAATRSGAKGGAAASAGPKTGGREDAMMDTDTAGPEPSPSTTAPTPSTSAAAGDTSAITANTTSDTSRAPIRTVLVCRADIDPPLLVAHIPHLVAACNSSNSATRDPNAKIKLVSLPKGSEATLAAAMGLRRVSVLGFDDILSNDPTLSSLLSSVQAIVAPWLVGVLDATSQTSPHPNTTQSKFKSRPKSKSKPTPSQTRKSKKLFSMHLESTHIKQLRTTAPKDMRLAKSLRAKGRAEAKAQRREAIAKEREKDEAKKEKLLGDLMASFGGIFAAQM